MEIQHDYFSIISYLMKSIGYSCSKVHGGLLSFFLEVVTMAEKKIIKKLRHGI